MRKLVITAAAIAGVAALALTGCSSSSGRSGDTTATTAAGFPAGSTIGVALPDKTSENWTLAGGYFQDAITAAGFKADIQYAGSSTPVQDQQNQIETMIQEGAKVIIIGANDAKQLGTQVKEARDAGITVISYDRLISDTADVDYYVAFNNYKVGQDQGQALLDGLAAQYPNVKPWNVELFSGAATDPNAAVFFNGAMNILQPKIDDGTLKVVSGETAVEQTATDAWDPKNAQTRMDTLLQGSYTGSTNINGVLSPNDTLARAIYQSITDAKKGPAVITGQDSEAASIPFIMEGKQYMTIYKDTRELVKQALTMVTELSQGKKADTTTTENNGSVDVPTFYLDPVVVTKDNAVEAYANNDQLEALAKKG